LGFGYETLRAAPASYASLTMAGCASNPSAGMLIDPLKQRLIAGLRSL